jgi:diacylglycerol kinase (ATP)
MKKEQDRFSIRARLSSFRYAFNGLKVFFRTQHNAWIHAATAAVVITAGFILGLDRWEWALIVIAIAIVLVSEAFNTAVEFLTDIVSPAYNEKAGKIKDLAAAGVLIASVSAATIGTIVFLPYILLAFQ